MASSCTLRILSTICSTLLLGSIVISLIDWITFSDRSISAFVPEGVYSSLNALLCSIISLFLLLVEISIGIATEAPVPAKANPITPPIRPDALASVVSKCLLASLVKSSSRLPVLACLDCFSVNQLSVTVSNVSWAVSPNVAIPTCFRPLITGLVTTSVTALENIPETALPNIPSIIASGTKVAVVIAKVLANSALVISLPLASLKSLASVNALSIPAGIAPRIALAPSTVAPAPVTPAAANKPPLAKVPAVNNPIWGRESAKNLSNWVKACKVALPYSPCSINSPTLAASLWYSFLESGLTPASRSANPDSASAILSQYSLLGPGNLWSTLAPIW